MAETPPDCAALAAQITELQTEFEAIWLKVSQGAAPTPRYREVRHLLDELRARYASTCGAPSETSALPRAISSDWRAG